MPTAALELVDAATAVVAVPDDVDDDEGIAAVEDVAAAEVARLVQRLNTVTALLAPAQAPATSLGAALHDFAGALDGAELATSQAAWLACVAASGTYPDAETVATAAMLGRRAGATGLADLVESMFLAAARTGRELPELEVLQDVVLVDITHTTTYDLHTGIQRVARECASRWLQREGTCLVHFDERREALVRLSADEHRQAIAWRDHMHVAGSAITKRDPHTDNGATIVPWNCVHVIPELVDWGNRIAAYAAMRIAGVLRGLSMIGFDLIPVTAAEYTATGVPEGFARYLSLMKRASAVSAISPAAAGEFRSFFTALQAQGLSGPRVTATMLPSGSIDVTPADLDAAQHQFRLSGLPLVLVVGSHEPRKNHLSILEAAARLWDQGARFELLFVGGASWGKSDFADEIKRLTELRRPVQVYHRISEVSLWALYRLAEYSVFVSFLEGFGLPVAESLCVGTPVVTSQLGSMAEIAAGGGAWTVDPYDVDELVEAMATLLSDRDRLDGLRADAAARTWETWDDYADQLWSDLVERVRADGDGC